MRTSKITTALAVTALIVAVLGTTPLGHAAGSILPRNSVGTVQVKKAAITSGKLKANAVTGTKVLDGSLTAADFKAGSLPAGAKGDTGATGPSDVYSKAVSWHQIGTAWTEIATLTMPSGQYLVTAKLQVEPNGYSIPSTVIGCQLFAGNSTGGSHDYTYGTIASNAAGAPTQIAPLSFAQPHWGADRAMVRCTSPVGAVAENVVITAIKTGAWHY